MERYRMDSEYLYDLARKGLILSDEGGADLAELRKREEQLSSTQWNIYAALYHFMTKWHDVQVHLPIRPDSPDDSQTWGEINSSNNEMIKDFVDCSRTPP